MVRVEQCIDVPAPVEMASAYVAEFAHTAEWDPGVAAARRLTHGPLGAGTRYRVDVVFMGMRSPMDYEVLLYEPGERVVLRGESSTVVGLDDIAFEALSDDRTRIRWRLDLSLRGFRAMTEPWMSPLFHQLGRNAMKGLSSAFEKGVAPPLHVVAARAHA